MKFIILNKYFIEALKRVNNLLTRNNTHPILENVLLETNHNTLFLTSTNTEIEIKISISKNISILTPGNITISGKKILDICKSLSKKCNLYVELINEKLQILINTSRYILTTLPPINFPNLKISEHQITLSIPQKIFQEILHSTYFSMAIQDVRYFLNGLLLEIKNQNLYAVATDGYRIAICKTPIKKFINKDTFSIILPRKGTLELIKLLKNYSSENIIIKISNNYFQLKINNLIFTSKIIIEKFPNYTSIILTEPNKKIILNSILFKEALSRVAILSNEKFKGVNIYNNNYNELIITTRNQHDEEAFEILNTIHADIKIKISINAFYIIDVLNIIKENEVLLLINESTGSIQIQTNNNNSISQSIYIIMPLQL